MDINARINWRPGMELTTQTFLDLDENLDFRQQTAIRAATEMIVNPEGDYLKELPSHIRSWEDVLQYWPNQVYIGNKTPDELAAIPQPFYQTPCDVTERYGHFGQMMPQQEFLLLMQASDVFPVVRFTVKDGTFSIDNDFIPPCLLLASDKRFEDYRNRYADLLRQIGEHPNLKEGEGKQAMLRYMFRMRSQTLQGQGHEFLKLTQEVAQAVDYFIMRPNTDQTVNIPVPIQQDPSHWLKWLEDYLTGAVALADGVTLEDDSIDYEALLAQAKRELHEQLHPELYELLMERLKRELREELYNDLSQELRKYMDEVMKPALAQSLSQQLHQQLYEKLYTELFEHLFNALYVTMPEEKEYLPQI